MRSAFSLLLAVSLLSACGPATPADECTEAAKITGYQDADQDGHGDAATKSLVCQVGVGGWVPTGLDCDDTNSAVNPDVFEMCDGLDNDCDNAIDEGLREVTYFADLDGDTFGDIDLTQEACSPPNGYVENSADCNDSDPLSFPGSDEFCDGEDNDCDGLIDDADPDIDPDSQPSWFLDADGDTYGDLDTEILRCEPPSPQYVDNSLDCNDTSIGISPDAQEVCDAIDNDCDGLIDDSDPSLTAAGQSTWYEDFDGDGLGDASSTVLACNQPWFYVGDNTDCDDADENVLDATSTFWQVDVDGDSYGDPAGGVEGPFCDPPDATYVPANRGDDCDDNNTNVNPGRTEVCDTLDNDCDGLIDDADDSLDENTTNTYYTDGDGDGFGGPDATVEACSAPPNTSGNDDDCNDLNPAVNPDAPEVCNFNVDDNCNGLADAADPTLDPASAPTWFNDFDGDGWGDPTAGSTLACSQPAGLVDNDLDCDDNDPLILGDVGWLADADGDGVGAGAPIGAGCVPPDPYAVPDVGPQDCNDADAGTYPGAEETCGDGIDQDCLGGDQLCPPDTCAEAMAAAVETADVRYVHDLTGYANDVSFADSNACTDHPTDGGDAILPIEVAANTNFAATLSGADNVSLSILTDCTAPDASTDCAIGGDAAGTGLSESVWYANLSGATETLYLVADCDGPCGAFSLDLDFDAPALRDTCASLAGVPALTTGGHSLAGSLEGLGDDSDPGVFGCTYAETGGTEAFLPIDLQSGEALTLLDYTQVLDDASAYVVTNCADPFGTCLVGQDIVGAGQTESVAYSNSSGVTERVYLVLDCYAGLCRDFDAHLTID